MAESPAAPEDQNDAVQLATTAPEDAAAQPDEQQQQLEPAKKKKVIVRRKKRPARVQVDPSTVKSEPPPQTGTTWNIWYSVWSGGDRDTDKYGLNTPAPGRCVLSRDQGYTRADRVVGSFFCLYFARGICHRGADCDYLHRRPTPLDIFSPNVDCFGRDKHASFRDDMGGTGSFNRINRTLYVGRVHVSDDIEEVVSRHFQEWGEIDRIRVLTGRGVAFVTYSNEANAQFAMQAMSHQSLDHDEILNVRWATVDPNPLAQKREARLLEEQAADAVRRALPAAFVAEIEGRDPEAKKRKKIEGSFGLNGYDVPDDVWHARTRQLENTTPAADQLETSEPLMIESASASAQDSAATWTPAPQPESGIFSSATVTALRGLQGGTVTTQAAPKASGGPLVAYGSEDESD